MKVEVGFSQKIRLLIETTANQLLVYFVPLLL
jgi:hypothetical protein